MKKKLLLGVATACLVLGIVTIVSNVALAKSEHVETAVAITSVYDDILEQGSILINGVGSDDLKRNEATRSGGGKGPCPPP